MLNDILLGLVLRRSKAYKEVFSTDAGKEILKDLAKHSGVYTIGCESDPLRAAYNKGKIDFFHYVMNIIKEDPEVVRRMVQEDRESQHKHSPFNN